MLPRNDSGSRFSSASLFCPSHFALERFVLPLELRRYKLDLLHAMDFFSATSSRIPQVLTVHDLYFLRDPSAMDGPSFRHYRQILKYAVSAAHIICDSNSTRRDLIEFCPTADNRSSVIYPGINHRGWQQPRAEGRHILFVGTLEARKNIPTMLKAYAMVRKKLGVRSPRFVIVGRDGFGADAVKDAIRSLNLSNSVEIRSSASDDELRELYCRAHLLLYASLYEGFGFPLLEAMAAGIPIVTSNNSSMTEIAGEAALFVDPKEPELIAGAIERLLDDSTLTNGLIEAGRQQVVQFSWNRTALAVLNVYDQLSALR